MEYIIMLLIGMVIGYHFGRQAILKTPRQPVLGHKKPAKKRSPKSSKSTRYGGKIPL